MILRILFLALACLGAATAPALAAEPMSEAQRQSIEGIVRDYILAHPEVLLEALERLEAREEAAQAEQQRAAMAEHRKALEADPDDPVAGNPDGDVTIVEFFDYNCPYCRRVTQPLLDVAADDGKIRVVFKEFPILGEGSMAAAKAALAAHRQGKYLPFHLALMAASMRHDEASVLAIAGEAGLDVETLKSDMEIPEIEAAILKNLELARTLGITGTPAFVVGDQIAPGAIPAARMKQMVEEARKG